MFSITKTASCKHQVWDQRLEPEIFTNLEGHIWQYQKDKRCRYIDYQVYLIIPSQGLEPVTQVGNVYSVLSSVEGSFSPALYAHATRHA